MTDILGSETILCFETVGAALFSVYTTKVRSFDISKFI